MTDEADAQLEQLRDDCLSAYIWLKAIQEEWHPLPPTRRQRQALSLVCVNLLAMAHGLPRPHGWDTEDAEKYRLDEEKR